MSQDNLVPVRGSEKHPLAQAEPLGDVYVVAPDREQSATSHSLTLHHPLRPVRRAERRWQVDGTPTDCVMLAVEALMDQPDLFYYSGLPTRALDGDMLDGDMVGRLHWGTAWNWLAHSAR